MFLINKIDIKKIKRCAICVLSAVFIINIFLQTTEPKRVFAAENYPSNPHIRIGLVFGSGAVDSFETYATAENGYIIGYVKKNTGDTFISAMTLNKNRISVTRDENLAKNSAGKYYVSSNNITIGKYNAEFTNGFSSFSEAGAFINNLPKDIFKNAFPALVNGKIAVRVNNYATVDAANDFIAKAGGYSLKAVGGTKNGMAIIDPATDATLFEYENDEYDMAMAVVSGYIRTPATNLYTGAFIYRAKGSAVEIINLTGLEDYVKGLVTTEISPEWHEEAIKAFAIAARSYTLYSGSRHSSDGYTLCNDVHCQWFLGLKYATDKSNAAVDATKDLVITYNGKPIEAVYYSSAGGVSETHSDAWGGELTRPYLVSVSMPFENYQNHNNALWKNYVSPKELANYLRNTSSYSSKFSETLKGDIAKIKINERSNSSGYIKDVDIIDKNGNSVNIKNSDSVRIAFSKYANSANMDIYTSFSYPIFGKSDSLVETKDLYVISSGGSNKIAVEADGINILTANGRKTFGINEYNFVFDGKGWGHGVGMSQYGVKDLAEASYGYADIVKAFYTGVAITRITDIAK